MKRRTGNHIPASNLKLMVYFDQQVAKTHRPGGLGSSCHVPFQHTAEETPCMTRGLQNALFKPRAPDPLPFTSSSTSVLSIIFAVFPHDDQRLALAQSPTSESLISPGITCPDQHPSPTKILHRARLSSQAKTLKRTLSATRACAAQLSVSRCCAS